MKMLKRSAQRQITDLDPPSDDDDGGDGGNGVMNRASAETMKKRRIIRASGRGFSKPASSSSGPLQVRRPPSAGVAAASVSFAGGAPPSASSSSSSSPAAPKNPFAAISFAGGAAAAPPTPAATPASFVGFSGRKTSAPGSGFARSAPAAKKPKASSSPLSSGGGFSLGSTATTKTMATTKTTAKKARKGNVETRGRKLNQNFMKCVVDHGEHRGLVDWSGWVEEYVGWAKDLIDERDADSEKKPTPFAAASARRTKGSVPKAIGEAAPTATAKPLSFAFGAPAPAPAPVAPISTQAKPVSFSFGATSGGASPAGATPAPAPGFSFGGLGAPPAASSSAPSLFSGFGAPAPAPAPPVATLEEEAGDEPEGVDAVLSADDADETVLYTITSKHMKMIDAFDDETNRTTKKWKAFGVGTVKLYRNKTTQKCKLVKRNDATGKIDMNYAVGAGMTFDKRRGKKNKAMVQFMTTGGLYILQVKPEDLDELHAQLVGMAKA